MRPSARALTSVSVSAVLFSATVALAYALGFFRWIDIVQRHSFELEGYKFLYLSGLLLLAFLFVIYREAAIGHRFLSVVLSGVAGHGIGVLAYTLCYYRGNGIEGIKDALELTGFFGVLVLFNTASVMHIGFLFPIVMIVLLNIGKGLWSRVNPSHENEPV